MGRMGMGQNWVRRKVDGFPTKHQLRVPMSSEKMLIHP